VGLGPCDGAGVRLGPVELVEMGAVLGCIAAGTTLGCPLGSLFCTGLAAAFRPDVGALVVGLAAAGATEP
jgi:hypothetical protein